MKLHLTLNKKWFYMIARGEKKEEYREIKPYWEKRLVGKQFNRIIFKNGYAKDAMMMIVECKGIEIGKPKEEWCPKEVQQDDLFIIHLGKVLFCNALL